MGDRPMQSNELDHIAQQPTVIESTRIEPNVAIMWAEDDWSPAMNAVEVAADHGIDVSVLEEKPGKTQYRVEV